MVEVLLKELEVLKNRLGEAKETLASQQSEISQLLATNIQQEEDYRQATEEAEMEEAKIEETDIIELTTCEQSVQVQVDLEDSIA